MTVDELIRELQKCSDKGYGDDPVKDVNDEEISLVTYLDFPTCREVWLE